ncbi:Hypothetical predicted protein [Pelobates cultripes]|uniref:Uncharacterized protein n=1 Tax=Pelobates cultripes TaxID=61616 RepID=A0AAD1RGD7_PELCU|nr:Hypothetical predicted protein [Pelobates cultripes]
MEEPMVTIMTTTLLIQSVEKRNAPKRNTAKPPFGAPGLVKASDGTLMPFKELNIYENYLDVMRYVDGEPPEKSSNQVLTCSSSQPVTVGIRKATQEKHTKHQIVNSG